MAEAGSQACIAEAQGAGGAGGAGATGAAGAAGGAGCSGGEVWRPDGEGSERSGRAWAAVTSVEVDLGACTAWVGTSRAGAVATFTGVTRGDFGGRAVLRLEYEAYKPMALRELKRICEEVLLSGCERVAIVHRLGTVGVGGTSVVIATSSAHRGPALAAVQHAIDAVKAFVPIWKKEFYSDGEVWKENSEWEGGPGSRRRLMVRVDAPEGDLPPS